MHARKPLLALLAAAGLASLAACGSMGMNEMPAYNQMSLPDTLRVPAGHKVALETVGVGGLTYECRARANMPGQFEWVVIPDAKLNDRSGKQIGKYYGPPPTFEAMDGSKVTAAQAAAAPGGDGNLTLQLLKANPSTGTGAMQNVSFIQRVATKGGAAPAATGCTQGTLGTKQNTTYQADYIFYKPV